MDIYEAIKKDGDLAAQMRLAMKTGLASQKAKEAPDSPENIQKFKEAYKEITGKNCPIS
jgi:hypothetical protein